MYVDFSVMPPLKHYKENPEAHDDEKDESSSVFCLHTNEEYNSTDLFLLMQVSDSGLDRQDLVAGVALDNVRKFINFVRNPNQDTGHSHGIYFVDVGMYRFEEEEEDSHKWKPPRFCFVCEEKIEQGRPHFAFEYPIWSEVYTRTVLDEDFGVHGNCANEFADMIEEVVNQNDWFKDGL